MEPINLNFDPKRSTTENQDVNSNQLSKRKQKRLLREKQWQESKSERKRLRKERRKARKMSGKNDKNWQWSKQKLELIKMNDSKCKVTIIIDCDYEIYMKDEELKKLCKQLNRCYAINRRSSMPVQLWLTSINGKIKELLNRLQPGHFNWDCHYTDKHWSDIFPTKKFQDKLFYLSGDSSENIPNCKQIQESNDFIFIIGGLIDKNRHKGLTLTRAIDEFCVKHGKLPICDNIKINQRTILSVPHVFEIMLFASNGTIGTEWKDILTKVIPKRKLSK